MQSTVYSSFHDLSRSQNSSTDDMQRPKTAMIITRPLTSKRLDKKDNSKSSNVSDYRRSETVPNLAQLSRLEDKDVDLDMTSYREVRGYFMDSLTCSRNRPQSQYRISKKENNFEDNNSYNECSHLKAEKSKAIYRKPIFEIERSQTKGTTLTKKNTSSDSNKVHEHKECDEIILTDRPSVCYENNLQTFPNAKTINCDHYQHQCRHFADANNNKKMSNKSTKKKNSLQTNNIFSEVDNKNWCSCEQNINSQCSVLNKLYNSEKSFREDVSVVKGKSRDNFVDKTKKSEKLKEGNKTSGCSDNNYTLNTSPLSIVREKTMILQNDWVQNDKGNKNIRGEAYQTTRLDETSYSKNHNAFINNNTPSKCEVENVEHKQKANCCSKEIQKDFGQISKENNSQAKPCHKNEKYTSRIKKKLLGFSNIDSKSFKKLDKNKPKNMKRQENKSTKIETMPNSVTKAQKGKPSLQAAVNLKPRIKNKSVLTNSETNKQTVNNSTVNTKTENKEKHELDVLELKSDENMYVIMSKNTNDDTKNLKQVHGLTTSGSSESSISDEDVNKEFSFEDNDSDNENRVGRIPLPTPPPSALKKTGSAASSTEKKQKVKFDMDIEIHFVPRDSYLPSPTESTTTEIDESDYDYSLDDEESEFSVDPGEVFYQEYATRAPSYDYARNQPMQNASPFRVIRNNSSNTKKNPSYNLARRDSLDLAKIQQILSQQARERVYSSHQMASTKSEEVDLRQPRRFQTPPRTPYHATRDYRHSHHHFSPHAPKLNRRTKHHRNINGGTATPEQYIAHHSRQQQLQQYIEYERRLRRQHLYSGQIKNYATGKNVWESDVYLDKDEHLPTVNQDNTNLPQPKPYVQSVGHTKVTQSGGVKRLPLKSLSEIDSGSSLSSRKDSSIDSSSYPQTSSDSSNFPTVSSRTNHMQQRPYSNQQLAAMMWSRIIAPPPKNKPEKRFTRERTSANLNRQSMQYRHIVKSALQPTQNTDDSTRRTFASLSENARQALRDAHIAYTQSLNMMPSNSKLSRDETYVPRNLNGNLINRRSQTQHFSANKYDFVEISDNHDPNPGQLKKSQKPIKKVTERKRPKHSAPEKHEASIERNAREASVVVNSLGLNATVAFRRPSREKTNKPYDSGYRSNSRTSNKSYDRLISEARSSSDDYVAILNQHKPNRTVAQESNNEIKMKPDSNKQKHENKNLGRHYIRPPQLRGNEFNINHPHDDNALIVPNKITA